MVDEVYEGQWHRTFDAAGLRQEHFNGRMLLWLNLQLSRTYTNLAEAQQAYATSRGAYNWSSLAQPGGGGLSLLARLLAVPGLVSAYDVADTSSLGQALTFGAGGAIGSPVGFALDKVPLGDRSATAYLASAAELAVNGTFDTDVSGWTNRVPGSGGMTWVAGKLRMANIATNNAYQSFATVVGSWYQLTGTTTVVDATGSTFYAIRKADNNSASVNVVSLAGNTGVASPIYFKATATTTFIILQVNVSSGTPTIDFDGISVKRVPGYPAISDTTGHRPTLHSGPYFDFDGVDDVLSAQIGADLGAACSVYHRTQAGADVWLDGQTIGAGAYALSTTDWGRAAIFSSLPSAADKLVVQAWGAAFPTPPFDDGFLALVATFGDATFVPTALQIGGQGALDKLVVNGDGTSQVVSPNIPDFYPELAAAVRIRYRVADDFANDPPSGTLAHWSGIALAGHRPYISTAGGLTQRLLYATYHQSPGYLTEIYKYPDDGGIAPGRGYRSVVLTWQEGSKSWGVADNYIAREEPVGAAVEGVGTPLSIAFGRNEIFDNDLATNVRLYEVAYKKGFLSQEDIEAWAIEGAVLKIHEVGDSFVGPGNHVLEHTLCGLNDAYPGVYIAISADGVGGTTLSQQRDRTAAYAGTEFEKWYDSYLLILDGANGDTFSGGRQAVLDMLAMCGGRGAYIEPSPQFWEYGDPLRVDLDAKTAAIRAAVGDSRFIPTFAPITNTDLGAGPVYHDGSPEDLDYIAQGFWPLSLLRAPADFHPGDTVNSAGWSGETALGDIKARWLIANGVVPT